MSNWQKTIAEVLPDGVVNVKDYGAKGDGITDDTAAIQAAIAAGKTILVPEGTYIVSSTIDIGDDKRIFGLGVNSIRKWAGSSPGIVIILGESSEIDSLLVTRDWIPWDISNPVTGIQFSSSTSKGNNIFVSNFEKGIELLGDGKGCAYNQIFLRYIIDCYYGIYLRSATSGSVDGWVNENSIYGGRLAIFASHQTTGTYGIFMESGNPNEFNNNKFFGPSIEGYDYAFNIKGSYNTLVDPRIELPNLGNAVAIEFEDTSDFGAEDNFIFGGYGAFSFGTDPTVNSIVHKDSSGGYVSYHRDMILLRYMPAQFLDDSILVSGKTVWDLAYLIYDSGLDAFRFQRQGIDYFISGTSYTKTKRSLGINTTDFGGGKEVFAMANATTVPSANPTGGGVLYVQDGALKYRGSSGTVTTIAPA